MSSASGSHRPLSKHFSLPKRLPGSCDKCKKRRVKCDRSLREDGKCSNCLALGVECTRPEPPVKQRDPSRYTRRVVVLEAKVKELQDQLDRHRAVQDINTMADSLETMSGDAQAAEEELADDFQDLSLHAPGDPYFGSSSGLSFLSKDKPKEIHSPCPSDAPCPGKPISTRPPWEENLVPLIEFPFPEHDLLMDLMDLYFNQRPSHLPVLYQPHFRRDVAQGRHLLEPSFAGVVLLVCAIASRNSSDPRVLSDGTTKQTAGWKYYSVTSRLARPVHLSPTLDDIQMCCLLVEFTLTTSNPMACWTIAGLGLRYAVQLGLHRHRPNEPRTVESEVKARVFWVLLFYERCTSMYTGRPLSFKEEDYTTHLPAQCDEKYWVSHNFVQPEGVPCQISGFLYTFRLAPIMAKVVDLLSLPKSSKKDDASRPKQVESLVIIDSMLNAWFNGIPPQLRWDPSVETELSSSARLLLLGFYNAQILTHRAFINRPGPEAITSLVICTNAARISSHVIEQIQAKEPSPIFFFNIAAFTCGTVIVANMRKRRQMQKDYVLGGHDLDNLYRCLRVLRDSETRFEFPLCGEMIRTLQVLAELPIGDPYQRPSPTGAKTFTTPPSGYIRDPILYGLPPPTAEEWTDPGLLDANLGVPPQVDMSLFQDVDMWLEDSASGNTNINGILPQMEFSELEGQYIASGWPYA
ncbi:hypothetical protein CYLTODRAFT_422004 [Cylindrobasidium torrendii FP15055 ss-10]|uniref:Zn(2)-C6 fungal-type domain-containing protein n=1 Tax=Cylindrobasidium torrendii FP15055 ss-10 TaxID=1314674 RepID=A0A0D7BEN4_9AGAR|nr:hypothetical protein CYLTODRAFT_422004 [Cylindrobasidium torrendii FP15055 ss-10]